jgi:predicted nucleic acid-binding protein
MTPDCFLDTNVLFYAAMARFVDPAKPERARLLMMETYFGLSGQVMQEFFVNATRKTARPLTIAEALDWLEGLRQRPFAMLDLDLVRRGAEIAERYRIAYWDGAIVAAAERLGAPIVYSEDLSHGQTDGSVRVENPFRTH